MADWNRRLSGALRVVLALSLLGAALAAELSAPASARAEAAADPVARLQIVIKTVHIHDDRDWGDGEMSFSAGLYPEQARYDRNSPRLASMAVDFSAGDGEDFFLERALPQVGDIMGDGASPDIGMPVHAGQRYAFYANMLEIDGVLSANDYMGSALVPLDEGSGWGIGTHTVRSQMDSGSAGHFSVTFEVRRVPLPDLRAVNIKVEELPNNDEKRICAAIQNADVRPAGPFDVWFFINGEVRPDAGADVGGLTSGDFVWACGQTLLPATGEHTLKAVADGLGVLTESNETNNVYEQKYKAAAPAEPPAAARPDLTVTEIRINGEVPDGKDDCKKGKNDVAVTVRNGGSARAGTFAVRLVIDGEDEKAKSRDVAELDAGQEREIRFDNVRLGKGARHLTAQADLRQAVAESNESNNEKVVTATCEDDD
jgi:hypothetical protein